MNMSIPEIRVGAAIHCEGLSLFPLFSAPDMLLQSNYILSHEAMAAGTCVVREVSAEGEIPSLVVENMGDKPVLFVEGEEVRGGKQNRVLCRSVLAACGRATRIPVVCTEPRRWSHGGPEQFAPGSHCPPSMQYFLKTRPGGQQMNVWAMIRRQHLRLGIRSRSGNMSDATGKLQDAVENLRSRLPYTEGSTGFAVAIAGKVVLVELFDKPATCNEVYGRFVDGLVFDAQELGDTGCPTDEIARTVKLYMTQDMRWRPAEPLVGLGEPYCARGDDGVLATVLVVDGRLLHLSMSVPF